MKGTFLTLFILSFFLPELIQEDTSAHRGLASSWNIIPSRSLTGLHYVFKEYVIDENEETVRVTGPVVQIVAGDKGNIKIHKDGFSSIIDLEDFEEEQDLGQSVFAASTGSGSRVGTAFLVGRDIVFTNRHVMGIKSKAQPKDWSCGKFAIKLNHKDEKVKCRSVKFCSPVHDFCVVELEKMNNQQSVGSEVRILKLTNKVGLHKDEQLFHIGNAAGLGLQASKGRGMELNKKIKGEFNHFVPTLGGSSGAPIFNERGEVVGINYGHNGRGFIDDKAFNVGVLSSTIYNSLLGTNTETLKQIKSFRKWHRKSKARIEIKNKILKTNPD